MRLLPVLFVGLFATAAQQAPALLTILITTPANLEIPDNSDADVPHLNDFGAQFVGTTRTHHFRVHNLSGDTTAPLTFTFESGGGTFALAPVSDFNVAPGAFLDIAITYTPPNTTAHTGRLTITQTGSQYELNLIGRGLGFVTVPDLTLLQLKPAKAKLNKKTGLIDATVKLQLTNSGTGDALTPVIIVTQSQTPFFATPLVAFATQDVKPLRFPRIEGRVKSKRVNLKVTGLPNTSNFLFVNVDCVDELENDEAGNAIMVAVPNGTKLLINN